MCHRLVNGFRLIHVSHLIGALAVGFLNWSTIGNGLVDWYTIEIGLAVD